MARATVVVVDGTLASSSPASRWLRLGLGRGPGARVVGRVIGRGTSSAVAWAHGSDGVHCVSPGDLPTWWTSVELRRARAERRQLRHARAAACERAADRDGAVAGGTRVPLLGATFGEAATLRFRFEVSGDRRRSLCLWAARSSCVRGAAVA